MPLRQLSRQEQRTDNVFLLYHGASHVTGSNLGAFLGVPNGRDCDERYDYIVRWGSRRSVRYRPREDVINSRSSLRGNTNKLQSLRTLEDAGVTVPPFSTNPNDLEWPLLGRETEHARGSDINLILQQRDVDLTDNDFYVKYIPTKLEYRMHVANGEVFKVHEKRLRHEAENHPYIRNHQNGWVFVDPRRREPDHDLAVEALDALGLDFGAVDVIRGEDDVEYVLEVNSAPSLDEANLRRYGSRLAEMVGINDYPGLDADGIEFPDEDDSDTNGEN